MSEVGQTWATAMKSPEQKCNRLVKRRRQRALIHSLTACSGDRVLVVVDVFWRIDGSRGAAMLGARFSESEEEPR